MKSTLRKIYDQLSLGLAITAVLVIASSCQYDEVLPQEVEIPVDPISYSLDIQPFFDAKCVSCHGGSIPPNLSASGSYDVLISGNWINTNDPASSPLYQSIEVGGSMESYATPTERAILYAWIQQGASNN